MKLVSKSTKTYFNSVDEFYSFDYLKSAKNIMQLFELLKGHELFMYDWVVEFELDHCMERAPLEYSDLKELSKYLCRTDITQIDTVSFSGIYNGEKLWGRANPRSGVLLISKSFKKCETQEVKRTLTELEKRAIMKATHKAGDRYYQFSTGLIMKRAEVNQLFYLLNDNGVWVVSGWAMGKFYDAASDYEEIFLSDLE
ncbi:MAG: hypothetical protein IJY09_10545 [Lachnospiraceae bacterium]|nr:hypothetical protein [Lachnospiraceae bacterium]